MSDLPILEAGMHGCCVETIVAYSGPDEDGVTIRCQTCMRLLDVKQGKWRWRAEDHLRPTMMKKTVGAPGLLLGGKIRVKPQRLGNEPVEWTWKDGVLPPPDDPGSSDRASRVPAMTDTPRAQQEPSDAILTIPNLLTFLRLGILIPFAITAFGMERLDIAVLIATFGVITDLVDGRIARATGQITKLGILLDPLADRLGVLIAAAAILRFDLAPLWAVLAVVVRDVVLLAGAPVLRSKGRAIPPVSRVGKYGSFLTSLAFGLFLSSAWFDAADPIDGVRLVAWLVFWVAIPLYWFAAGGYMRAAWEAVRTPD